jgi:thermostable 8-oxoguanine DNA glycosylase
MEEEKENSMLDISRDFVLHWVNEYNKKYAMKQKDADEEKDIKDWLAQQCQPKSLDWDHFVRLGRWKTKRQTSAYKSNDGTLVEEATRLACEASNERLKLHILTVLRGVSVAVAATILHFMYPDKFPIFDIRARVTLKEAGLWNRSENDACEEAWLEYVEIMRSLAHSRDVSLRDLDKALYAYNKRDKKLQEKSC